MHKSAAMTVQSDISRRLLRGLERRSFDDGKLGRLADRVVLNALSPYYEAFKGHPLFRDSQEYEPAFLFCVQGDGHSYYEQATLIAVANRGALAEASSRTSAQWHPVDADGLDLVHGQTLASAASLLFPEKAFDAYRQDAQQHDLEWWFILSPALLHAAVPNELAAVWFKEDMVAACP